MAEEIGQFFSGTQKELKHLAENLQQLQKANNKLNEREAEGINSMYGNIQSNIGKIAVDIDHQLEDIFKNMMNNNNQTVQQMKDPSNNIFNSRASIVPKVNNAQIGGQFGTAFQSGIVGLSVSQSQILPTRKKESLDPRAQPFGKKLYRGKYSSQKILERAEQQRIAHDLEDKQLQKRVMQLKQTALATMSVGEKEGLLEMINKGKVSKHTDLSTLFFGPPDLAVPILKPIKLLDAKDKFLRRLVSSGVEQSCDLQSLKLQIPDSLLPPINSQQKNNNATPSGSQLGARLLRRVSDRKLKLLNIQDSLGNPFQLPSADPKKSYSEVQDSYSLHNIIIRKGHVLEETPEYESFKRTYENQWSRIESILKSLEKLMRDYAINLVTVDGKSLVNLASQRFLPSISDLVMCCVNKEKVLEVIKVPSLMYKIPNGKELAAVKLQSYWRSYRCQREYGRLKVMIVKVKVIQRGVRLWLYKKSTQRKIRDKNQDDLEYVNMLRAKLVEDWPMLSVSKRLEIHINTFAYDELKRLSMEKVSQCQNMQITRIFTLKDPLVEVIYVSPYELSSEIINYYYKILELGDIVNFRNRLHFVSPERACDFPSHTSLSRLLLYSPLALNRLKNIIKGKMAMIIPGFPSNDDIKLSRSLDVPLFSGEIQQQMICSSKSGSKRVFQECEVPMAPGAFEIYEEKELLSTLSILILNNISIDTWILKIDDESGSRGLAYFQVESIKSLKHLRQQKQTIHIDQQLLLNVQDVLTKKLPSKLKLAVPQLYRNSYREYINLFTSKGGIIEAAPASSMQSVSSPSICFKIDPVGDIKVIGSYDRITGSAYRIIACTGPQQSLPSMSLQMISNTIGKQLFSRGVFGYITVDLVAFPDPSDDQAHPLFWAISLDCYLNNYASACLYFDFLVKGHPDPITGECILEDTNSQIDQQKQENKRNLNHSSTRSFVYCPYICHSGLEELQFKSFFHLCRIESISFDLERRVGSSFVLLDSLQTALLGIMTVAENQLEAIQYLSDALQFLQKNLGKSNDKFNNNSLDNRTDKIYFSEVQSKLKLILRKYDRVVNALTSSQRFTSNRSSVYL